VSTTYHDRYWAALLLQRGPSGNIERPSASLAAAKVDLNPHQVDAALFAIQPPLSRGVILADEVGLGKTIEASIIIAQYRGEVRPLCGHSTNNLNPLRPLSGSAILEKRMTDTQLYLAIGVPVLANAAMLTLMATLIGARITSLESSFNARFASLEARFEILTGKVAELTDRVTRLEERTARQ
jgi:hypothetical protein